VKLCHQEEEARVPEVLGAEAAPEAAVEAVHQDDAAVITGGWSVKAMIGI